MIMNEEKGIVRKDAVSPDSMQLTIPAPTWQQDGHENLQSRNPNF
jgi:hypothetical protein